MHKLNKKVIQGLYSEAVYKRGENYYKRGHVNNLTYDLVGNSARATVIGNDIYDIEMEMKGNRIEASCTCIAFSNSGNCKHVCAVLLAIVNELGYSKTLPVEEGTKNARYRQAESLIALLGNNKSENSIVSTSEENVLKVEYQFKTQRFTGHYNRSDVFELQMKIGISRLYVVKDIRNFLDCVINRVSLEFGKNFTYVHNEQVFMDQDLEIIEKLIEIYRTESVYNAQASYYSDVKKGKSLLIPLYAADELLYKLQARNCIYEQEYSTYQQLKISEENLPFSFTLENGKSEEYQLKLKGHTEGVYYETYGWFALKGILYKLTREQQQTFQPFTQFIGVSKSAVIPISRDQVGAFVSLAMPKIKRIGKIDVSEKVSKIIIQPSLQTKVFVEGNGERIDVKLEYHYDSIVINPVGQQLEHEDKNQTILIRDAQKELEVMHAFESSNLKVDGDRFYADVEEEIFEFLYSTLQQLEGQADIFLTPSIKSLILPTTSTAKVAVNIESNGNLLDVDFSVDGIDQDKISHILQSVLEKKRYVRLPDGAFLSLMDNQLQDVAALYDELNSKSVEMLDGKMKMPLYRGIQIEERLTELSKDTRKFGKSFRQFIDAIKSPEEEEFQVPAKLQADLRDYQLTGFNWLKSLANYRLGGILADDMGLGKTVQCIAYIQSEMESRPDTPFLIVCPASLVYNWKNEFTKFAPNIHAEIATGTIQERKVIHELTDTPDVYITSYHTLRQDLDWYGEKEFHTMILDEAQAIKNYASKISQAARSINASKRFALSGTPIENSLDELWAIFQAIMPGFFQDQKSFRNMENETIARLVKPFILRRLKKDVLKELPDKIETVHYSELNKDQKELYLAYLDRIRSETKDSLESEGIGKGRIKILAGLTRLRQLCCHPSLFIDNYEGKSGKLEELLEIIKNGQENGRKMLIFSQFSSMLKIIKQKIMESGQSCFYLDGQTPSKERVKLVDEFNAGTESIFLISLKAGGTGLNLTSADTVILYDLWWNPAIEEQAIGRAHRMGQKNVVQVIKLIAEGTIEEKINELQQSKKELIDQVIQTGETMLSSLSESDIREILSI